MRTWRLLKKNFIKITLLTAIGLLVVNLLIKRNKIETQSIDPLKRVNPNKIYPKVSLSESIRGENFQNIKERTSDNYQLPINNQRLNELFKILQEKESAYNSLMQKLDLFSFSDLVRAHESSGNFVLNTQNSYKQFSKEIESFLRVKDKNIISSDKFIDELNYISNYYSFENERNNIKPMPITSFENKPVLITAANSHYYSPMQATVFLVHKYFPDHKLIIYDLGLSDEQYEITKKKCKCEVRKFNVNNEYSNVSPHVADLKTYAWKPLLIQEVLKEHESIMYMDSSIRLQSNEINSQIETLKTTGLLTQFIGLKLTCYTNPKQFEWFHETAKQYENFFTIEANFIMMRRNFINSLIMKAWVTCALDKDCIAPEGSSIGGCCGCHRFDQDALTIISGFLFGHPKVIKHLPAYSLTTNESYFFSVKRYEGMNYF